MLVILKLQVTFQATCGSMITLKAGETVFLDRNTHIAFHGGNLFDLAREEYSLPS